MSRSTFWLRPQLPFQLGTTELGGAVDAEILSKFASIWFSALAKGAAEGVRADNANRPMISVCRIEVDLLQPGEFSFVVMLKNVGSVPAMKLRSQVDWTVAPGHQRALPVPNTVFAKAIVTTLMPGTEYTIQLREEMTPWRIEAIKSGQLKMWLAGRVEYVGKRRKHYMITFGGEYLPSIGRFARLEIESD